MACTKANRFYLGGMCSLVFQMNLNVICNIKFGVFFFSFTKFQRIDLGLRFMRKRLENQTGIDFAS